MFFDNTAAISGDDLEDVTSCVTFLVSHCALGALPTGAGVYSDNLVYGVGGVPSTPGFADNTHNDPMYDPPTGNDYRLACGSVCIDAGDNSAVDLDALDVDENSTTSVTTPDLNLLHRNVSGLVDGSHVPLVDIGAYEKQLTYPCSTPTTGDIAPALCTDGHVNIDDLVAVIINWGSCPTSSSFCTGDVVSSHTTVDIDDLVAVVTNWGGSCVGYYSAGSFNSVQDCIDSADLQFTPHTQDWQDFLDRCIHGLCVAHIIDCD